jgi:hypothetical protein
MNFFILIFVLFSKYSSAFIRCSYDTIYYDECFVYDYNSPKCGPRLTNCPVVEIVYNTFCEVADCVVIRIFLIKRIKQLRLQRRLSRLFFLGDH